MRKLILPKPNLIVPQRALFIPRGTSRERQRGFVRLIPSLGLWGKAFAAQGCDFDGTNDWLHRDAGLTGAVSSKLFTVSMWLRIDGGDGAPFRNIFSSTPTNGSPDADFHIALDSSNRFWLYAENAASTVIMFITTTSTFTASATWLHVIMSVDMANLGASFIYVNDSDAGSSTAIFTNDTIDFVSADWMLASQDDGTFKFPGCVADLWFAPEVFMNASTESNRRKFRTAAGKPANLGPRGEGPTGTPPLVYFHLDPGEDPRNFAVNRGTGGDFARSGTATLSSTSPGA